GEVGGRFEQAGMGVEEVAGVRLATGRTPHQERQLPVGRRLLAQVVVDAQGVAALLVHVILGHRAAGVGGNVLERRRVCRGADDDDGVIHGAVFAEALDHARDGRFLLANGDINTDDVLFLLVDDGVDGDLCLAGLAVADDQLTLAAADGGHRVDGLEAGLERLVHRLPARYAGGVRFHGPAQGGDDGTLAVLRVAERINDAADEGVADRHAQELTRSADLVALGNLQVVTQDDDADRVLFEIEGEAAHTRAGELQHLARHRARQAVNAGDAVPDFEDPSHLAGVELGAVLVNLRLQY